MTPRFELFVDNLGSSTDFYTQVLGFTVVRDETDYVALERGNTRIGLGLFSDLPYGHPIRKNPRARPWGLRDFRLVDPDGYYLRITGP